MTAGTATTSPTRAVGGRSDAWLTRLVRGRSGTAVWERPAVVGLLVLTGILYTWNLSISGWANSFYSAAVQAGSRNWEAFFYGSSDAANSITVDKPPASLWLMELSVRVFGLSSWAILLPEALMGVATVGVVYLIVRRHFSAGTALLAGGILAVTPVAALMFRFNNPDAMLVLLETLAVYFTVRGIESARIRWVLWAGVMIGLGFLTKELEAFLVLPVLAAVYLFAAPTTIGKRFGHLFAALGAVIVSAGWWVAIVQLVPASMRPYIGGSQTNSFLELTFGYNGFGRLDGSETGSVTGGGGGAATTTGMWGATGIFRLFENEIGGQIAWLLPAALALLVAAVVLLWRAPRIDVRRAVVLLFGGWMLVTGLAFSFMAGIFHAYYTVALAPAVAGVVAIGAALVWQKREALWARILLATIVLGTGIWAWALLEEAPTWLPWLKVVVIVASVIGAALTLFPPRVRWLTITTVVVVLFAGLTAPIAYSLETVTTSHTGSIVTAGPTVQGSGFGGGGGGAAGGRPGTGFRSRGGTPPGFTQNGGGGFPGAGGGTAGGTTGGTGGTTGTTGGTTGTTGGFRGGQGGFGGRGFGGGGGAGGLLDSSAVSSQLAALLETDASRYTWVAAAVGSNSAAGYQLATQDPVMPIGGFNGSDPSPTLAQFKSDVAAGKIHYFIGGTIGRANGGSSASGSIAAWVEANFTAKTVDGVTLYDLTTGS